QPVPPAPAPAPTFRPRRFRWLRSPLREAGEATLRSWIVASALVFGPAAVADIVTGIAKPHPLTLVWAFGVALAMAVVNAIAWRAAFGVMRKLPRFAPWLIWPAAALGVAAWLANELGAYAKLGGKDNKLAIG